MYTGHSANVRLTEVTQCPVIVLFPPHLPYIPLSLRLNRPVPYSGGDYAILTLTTKCDLHSPYYANINRPANTACIVPL